MIKSVSATRRITLAACLFIFVEIALIAFVDRPLAQYVRTLDIHNHELIDFFRAWTNIGKSTWYLWISGLGALLGFALSCWQKLPAAKRRAWRQAAQKTGFFFACVAVSGIVTDIIKPIAGRARPLMLQREGFYGFAPFSFHAATNSMPSGHATTAFAVAFALMAFWPRGKPWLLAFAVAVGLSRIMVNAHYLSDVVAGGAVGIVTALVLCNLFRRRGWIETPRA